MKSSRTRSLAFARLAVQMLVAGRNALAGWPVGSVVSDLPKLFERPSRIETAPGCLSAVVWFRAETGLTSSAPVAGCKSALVV